MAKIKLNMAEAKMNNKSIDFTDGNYPAFVTCRDAVKPTGLSYKFLIEGCKSGKIPHVKVGNRYKVNLHLLLSTLDNLSQDSMK